MAARVGRQREASDRVPDTDAPRSQRKRPEAGRFLLQVDRQTKASYDAVEAATAAGMAIKTGHPLVHVSVYDSVECRNTAVELPEAS
jgi:hypothetical protein